MLNFLIKPVLAYDFNAESGLGNAAQKFGYDTAQPATPDSMIASGILYFLSFLGIIFLVLTIYAGITWMTSAGNEAKIKKARDILINSIIGLVIVGLAYAISIFVITWFAPTFLK